MSIAILLYSHTQKFFFVQLSLQFYEKSRKLSQMTPVSATERIEI